MGCVIVLALLVALVVFILLNVTKIRNTCGRLICVGVAGILISQTLINIGMVLGLAPVIGVTLPFVSYGGSSVMSLFFAIGMVQSVREKELTDNSLRFGGKAKRINPVNINFSNIAKNREKNST